MKKSYLAAAAILGAAVLGGEAHAVKIDLGKTKFKMGFRAKMFATFAGKRSTTDKTDFVISVPNARIYAKGSITKILKWTFQGDFNSRPPFGQGSTFRIVDAFAVLDFAREFKVVIGQVKLPFEMHSGIQSGWSFLMPFGPAYGLAQNPFTNPDTVRAAGSGSRSPQITVWGKVADGLFKYYVGVTDGDNETSTFNAKTGFFARVEIAPTMMGYKGHPGYVLKETYLGKQNTLTLGLSYYTRKQVVSGVTADTKAWAVDLLWEQNFGSIVPNLSVGYVDGQEFRTNCTATMCGDVRGLLIQGQVLLNQKTILGKPALAIRWAQSDPDNVGATPRYKSSVFGVTGQLYVKGVGNRIALTVDRVSYDAPNTKDFTDVALAVWYNF